MPILAWIVAATLLGGVLSVFAAAILALRAGPRQIPMLVSYAIGTMLGAAFLEILPHAFELAPSARHVSVTVLIGILLFFVLEKFVLWRHSHEGQFEVHTGRHGQNDHGRIAAMVIIGDTFHNCVDGVIIAGAFLVSIELGIITALAIITHEVPQEVGDFLVLLHSGYSKRQALGFNLIASGAMVVGGVVAYFALQTVHRLIPPLLGIAAASMLYISIADLIPVLRGRPGLIVTTQQVLLIAAGIGTIWVVGRMATSLAGV
ncbi:MAG TPA: ZIP family metal transporter [Burkholderiales bacterium]|jgi:zinc and cadmium transporter|nr:ZIP family metal transporter [Burkholderiales bacterium]